MEHSRSLKLPALICVFLKMKDFSAGAEMSVSENQRHRFWEALQYGLLYVGVDIGDPYVWSDKWQSPTL